MGNTKHDADSYENSCYKHETPLYDGNLLYDAYLKAKKSSSWKFQTQKFEMNFLRKLGKIQEELKNESYIFSPSSNFKINERGKTRMIHGERMRDRIVKHSLCDFFLSPKIEPYLIYDNGASIKGKGITFTRNRLLKHLRDFYRKNNNSNKGYILLIDFTKYYDNIVHEDLYRIFTKYISDRKSLWLIYKILQESAVDVSYMSDEEYSHCMTDIFNSILYYEKDLALIKDHNKFMPKHLNIGDQLSQIAGIAYPMELDNYIKIVKGVKYYGRYMDDSYIIAKDKETLQSLLKDIEQKTKELGIFLNTKKTKICKLNSYWRFLQIQYSLTDTGRVIQKINPKRLTAIRRQMKKLVFKLPEKEFAEWFKSWLGNYYKIMSKQQKKNIINLFYSLLQTHYQTRFSKKKIIKWLKNLINSPYGEV